MPSPVRVSYFNPALSFHQVAAVSACAARFAQRACASGEQLLLQLLSFLQESAAAEVNKAEALLAKVQCVGWWG